MWTFLRNVLNFTIGTEIGLSIGTLGSTYMDLGYMVFRIYGAILVGPEQLICFF